MKPKIVLIAGGSGSGKSTLAVSLYRSHPESIALLHLDDYYKSSEDAPKLSDGSVNWDHPDALRFDKIIKDVDWLSQEKPIHVLTKGELYNPEYSPALKNKVRQTIEPRPVIIVEGYLTLYSEALRSVADLRMYLEMPIEESIVRRATNKFIPPEEYFASTLIPVHKEFVEPSRVHADVVIDVAECQPDVVATFAESIFKIWGIL